MNFPLFVPIALAFSSIADAVNATSRLYGVFEAETLDETHVREDDLESAVEVKGASFTWDSSPPEVETTKKQKGHGKEAAALAEAAKTAAVARAAEKAKEDEDNVFQLKDVNMEIPRAKLVAIVGAVGSGKSSLLQGIIGEMRRTSGTVKFCGSVAYCPQSAWIQVSSNHRSSLVLVTSL